MDAVTYPNKTVISFINDKMIPLRVPFNSKPYSIDFNVKWTPTIITLDSRSVEHNRTIGFLSESDLIASLMLGMGKTLFDGERFGEAEKDLETLLTNYPESEYAPEAVFWRGVSRYKNTQDPTPLKAAYEELTVKYPESEWTKRAYPYRLI
ncbi:MAG: tetratricopeptide repeat protein [Nitrospira sp.]|nr:tetratricopeptide repeat protein [bacterium]MBL7048133.1 tetratricopeptide repeat protein [Nitrospira sp.]